MSDNLFSFPGESTGQDAGDFFGGAGGIAFTDLGSADEVENGVFHQEPGIHQRRDAGQQARRNTRLHRSPVRVVLRLHFLIGRLDYAVLLVKLRRRFIVLCSVFLFSL